MNRLILMAVVSFGLGGMHSLGAAENASSSMILAQAGAVGGAASGQANESMTRSTTGASSDSSAASDSMHRPSTGPDASSTSRGAAGTGVTGGAAGTGTGSSAGAPSPAGGSAAEWQAITRSSKLAGSPLYNPQGQKIGVIQDVVLDPYRGQIAYAVVSFERTAGVGANWYTVPWSALSMTADNRYVLTADMSRVASMQGFAANQFPRMDYEKWHSQQYVMWGLPPYWTGNQHTGVGRWSGADRGATRSGYGSASDRSSSSGALPGQGAAGGASRPDQNKGSPGNYPTTDPRSGASGQ